MVDVKDSEGYKAKLLIEKEKLEKQVKALQNYDMGDDTDHGEEEADELEEYMNVTGETAPLQARLEDIKIALDKMTEGTYGICEKCRQEIGAEVLEAVPESRLCQNCKSAA